LEGVKTDADRQNNVERNEVGMKAKRRENPLEGIGEEVEILEKAENTETGRKANDEDNFFQVFSVAEPVPDFSFFGNEQPAEVIGNGRKGEE